MRYYYEVTQELEGSRGFSVARFTFKNDARVFCREMEKIYGKGSFVFQRIEEDLNHAC